MWLRKKNKFYSTLLFWVEFRKDLGKGLVVGLEVTTNAYPRTLREAEDLHRPEFLQISWQRLPP